MEEYRKHENVSIKMNMKSNQKGISLLELVVVISIMTILVGVIAPSFMGHIGKNKTKECIVDREGILAVFERCVYEETLGLNSDDLSKLLNGTVSGADVTVSGMEVAINQEVSSFFSDADNRACALGGTYSGTVDPNTQIATIKCSCGKHPDVSVDFTGIMGIELTEEVDVSYEEPSEEESSSTPTSETTEETTEEPAENEPPFWPYPDADRNSEYASDWPDPRQGAYCKRDRYAPTKVEKDEPSGLYYVIVARNRNGQREKIEIPYERAEYGPISAGLDPTGSSIYGRVAVYSGRWFEYDDIKTADGKVEYGISEENKVSHGDIILKGNQTYIVVGDNDGAGPMELEGTDQNCKLTGMTRTEFEKEFCGKK